MQVWQLIEKLKNLPQHTMVVVDGFESVGYDRLSIIEEIEVQQDHNDSPYAADFEEYEEKDHSIKIKAIRLR